MSQSSSVFAASQISVSPGLTAALVSFGFMALALPGTSVAWRLAVAGTAAVVGALRPDLKVAALATPMTMLLFGMINWMFTWLKPEGALDHKALAPMVAELFLGGLPAVRLPEPVATAS